MKSTNLTTHGFKLGSCLLVRLTNFKNKRNKIKYIYETNCQVPVNIITHTVEGHWKFLGVGLTYVIVRAWIQLAVWSSGTSRFFLWASNFSFSLVWIARDQQVTCHLKQTTTCPGHGSFRDACPKGKLSIVPRLSPNNKGGRGERPWQWGWGKLELFFLFKL